MLNGFTQIDSFHNSTKMPWSHFGPGSMLRLLQRNGIGFLQMSLFHDWSFI